MKGKMAHSGLQAFGNKDPKGPTSPHAPGDENLAASDQAL